MSKLKDNIEIRKLDTNLSNQLRSGQVITKISDIVRELVDNSIDSDASSVQVFLDNFGLKKIQVKDSGHGIPTDDVPKIVMGGHTSKLQDSNHLSCNDQYGFRGEGLAAICFFNDVTITTKTADDSTGRKYVIGNSGEILKESLVASGNGTNIIVTNLFSKFPVRRQYISETKVCKTELKEIETYLKAISIANHQIYFALNHNGNNVWSKPAVKTTNQALSTVLGVNIANKLSKCQSVTFELEQNENGSSTTTTSNIGKFDLFIPTPPVDMKNLGFTSNRMLLIYVNRRRVSIKEFENLIKRYAIGASESPTQAEQRKYPVAAMLIELPPSEVDFNRDLDKSKVFITCRELIRDKLEEALQSFYGMNLSSIEEDRSYLEKSAIEEHEGENEVPTTPNIPSKNNNNDKTDVSIDITDKNSGAVQKSSPVFVPLMSTPESTPEKRRENIRNFMGDLISSGSKGETKSSSSAAAIVTKHMTPKKLNGEHKNDTITTSYTNNDNEVSPNEMTTKSLQELPVPNFDDNVIPLNYQVVNIHDDGNGDDKMSSKSTGDKDTSSNFNISTDDILNDDLIICSTQDDTLKKIELCKLQDDTNIMDVTTNRHDKNVTHTGISPPPPPQAIQPPRNSKSNKVLIGFSKPTSSTVNGQRDDDIDEHVVSNISFQSKNSSSWFASGSRSIIHSTPRPTKKLKLFDKPYDANCSQLSAGGPRQVTLDSMRNWQAQPKPSMKSLKASHLKNLSSTSSRSSISRLQSNTDDLIPASKNYLENKRRRRDSTISSDGSEIEFMENSIHNDSYELDESLLDPQFSNTLDLTASISLKHVTNETIANALQIVSPENSDDVTSEVKIISRVRSTNCFLINIRGNLGLFNPNEVLLLFPHIRDQINCLEVNDMQLSEKCADTILQEFMKCAETMDTDCTAQVFYFLANLNEYDDSDN